MLCSVFIDSLGLIDTKSFKFHLGLTSITGETGSGKTSLIEAIKLVLGKKSDFELIKKGSLKAQIKATFELESSHPIFHLLEELEIPVQPDDALVITRVLTKEGKSKAMINEHTVSQSTLVKLAPYLCDFIDQDALMQIKQDDEFIQLLDQTGPYKDLLRDYREAFTAQDEIHKQLLKLKKHLEDKEFKQSAIEDEIKELSSAKIKAGEEKELFESYKKAQGLQGVLQTLEQHVSVLNQNLLPNLRKMRMDKSLNDTIKAHVEEAYIHLCEVSSELETNLTEGNLSPQELSKMEERLKLIHSLKRKYQVEADDFEIVLQDKNKELDFLFKVEDEYVKQTTLFEHAHQNAIKLATLLSNERKAWAQTLASKIQDDLRPLNMPYAECQFKFTFLQTLTTMGLDHIDFWLKANSSSNLMPMNQTASGGELARVNFCFFLQKTKHKSAMCYFFDEIDASVGGITSSLMGERLKELALSKQVFCVTHFPQMAQKAQNHLVFEKKQNDQGTFIDVHYSENGPIDFEIDRMIGVKE